MNRIELMTGHVEETRVVEIAGVFHYKVRHNHIMVSSCKTAAIILTCAKGEASVGGT